MNPLSRRRFLRASLGAGGLLALGAGTHALWPHSLLESRRTSHALGTKIELVVLHTSAQAGQRAIDDALAAIDRVEEVMSLYRPSSQLCQLNRDGTLAGPHPWLVEVLQQARELSLVSDGAFDVTMQPLWLCWSQAERDEQLPTAADVQAARQLVDWRAMEISPERIVLCRPGMAVTLNGIAQGFAADRAVAALQAAGVAHALINTGEVHALGNKSDGQPWTAGVQHPRHDDAYVAVARLDGRALSSSGDYATSFTADRRHHHIVDPRVGYSPTELASVSIVAPTTCEADALSTAVLVLGAEQGLRLIRERSRVDALLVFKDGRTHVTPGFPEEVVS